MKFEEYFSFEAIVGDLVKWRIAGKDVGGTLPARKAWSRAGAKERKGVAPDVVRRQAGHLADGEESVRGRGRMLPMWKCCQCQCCQLPIAVGAEFDAVGGGGARGGVFGEGGV